MNLITPYITNKFTAYLGDILTTNLSIAVWLIDEYTKEKPIGHVKVMIKEGNIKAFKNLSGYYCFIGMATGSYTINITSDCYFPKEISIDTSALDFKNPVVQIELIPLPSYPFPMHATLVRGVVKGLDGQPVTNADVKLEDKYTGSVTDERGEFVLYFKGIKKESINVEIKKGWDTKTLNATIEEGKTASLGIITFP